MENYQKEVQETIEILKWSHSQIEKVLADENLMHLKNKLLREIERQITTLSIQHGFEYETKAAESVAAGEPLRKIMGRIINVPGPGPEKQLLSDRPIQQIPIQQSAQEIEASEFKEKTLGLYSTFTDIENEAILDQFEDMVIRGVGKLAGLPVTENHPKKINVKFIDEIKDAIKKKSELENASKEASDATAADLGLNDDLGDDQGNDGKGEEELAADLSGNNELKDPPKKASVDGPVNDLNQKSGGDSKNTDGKSAAKK